MKRKYLAILMPTIIIGCLASCGKKINSNTSTNTSDVSEVQYTVKANGIKDDSKILFAWDYTLNSNTTSVIAYSKTESDSTSASAEFNPNKKLSIIITTDRYHQISDQSCTIQGISTSYNHYFSSNTNYYVWDLDQTPKQDIIVNLSYNVIEANSNINLKEFTIPSDDPYDNFKNLRFNATINGEKISYNNSDVIKASDLYNALDAKASNHVLKVKAKEGLVLKGFYENGDFFCDKLGITKGVTIKANYTDLYTLFTFSPSEDMDLKLDFSSFANNDYKTYSIKSTVSGTEADTPKIMVDGSEVTTLTYNTLNNASVVELVYEKSLFDKISADYTKVSSLRINDESFYSSTGRLVVDEDQKIVKVILKNADLYAVHPYIGYQKGAVSDLNFVPTKFDSLVKYEIKLFLK